MADFLVKPYVVLVRDRRVDIAGPFPSREAAGDWIDRWDYFTGDFRNLGTLLRYFDVHAASAYRPHHAIGLARLCAPADLDRDAARDWAAANAHRFINGFPPSSPDAVTEDTAP